MNILQIHNFYQFNGGEDGVVEAEKAMSEQFGHVVYSITAHNDNIIKVFQARKEFYNSLDKLLSHLSIDVAHVHNVYHIIGNGIYEYLAQRNIPIVQTLHNFRFLCPAGLFMDNENQICERCSKGAFLNCFTKKCYQDSYLKSFLMQWIVGQGRKEVNQYVTTFIALNPFFRDKFIEAGFETSRFIIKPNFLFTPTTTNSFSEIHQGYALFLGRISPEKGIDSLIEAFNTLNFKLLIAGIGEESFVNQLKNKAAGNSKIEFIGFVSGESKQELIQNASFLIIPSVWYENFPMTVLEAYSSGKPVIASAIGGLPFIVKDKVTGMLFEAGNSVKLREAVDSILRNDYFIELGKNAFQYFTEHFTEKQNYQQLMNIYQSAIEVHSKKSNSKG